MQHALACLLACAAPLAAARRGAIAESPVAQVVQLITELKDKLESDGALEQQSYDKYACWCEETLARKAKATSDARAKIEELSTEILKLTASIQQHQVNIKTTEKEIAANRESVAEATALREKEASSYQAEKVEAEQCIGALEAAIKVLTGAGTGAKKGFLETLQETQLLSAAAGLRNLLTLPALAQAVPAEDLELVKRFVEQPNDFLKPKAQPVDGFLEVDSALGAMGANPFGDYSPASTQIQGILKGMYDSFSAELERSNGEEAEKQKAFEALMATKAKELELLQESLQKLTADEAAATAALADAKSTRDDTQAQLEADEKFFAEAKSTCKEKAGAWAERVKLRTEELHGINKAIEILSSEEAKATFEASAATFLQLGRQGRDPRSVGGPAFRRLRDLAARYRSAGLAQIAAAALQSQTGKFDSVITMIDKMITVLREEGKEDIAHRDRCQVGLSKSNNDLEDLASDAGKAETELSRMKDEDATKEAELEALRAQINGTKQEMAERLELRNNETAEFQQGLKDDAAAVELLSRAIEEISAFYEANKIPLSLFQEPTYSVDPDKAPETSWKSSSYGGAELESKGVIGILTMLKEDIQADMQNARKVDAAAQQKYLEEYGALEKTLAAEETTEVTLEKSLAEHREKIGLLETLLGQHQADSVEEGKLKEALEKDCEWVETHFDTRQQKREAEIEGLQEAKGILAGAATGDTDSLSMVSAESDLAALG